MLTGFLVSVDKLYNQGYTLVTAQYIDCVDSVKDCTKRPTPPPTPLSVISAFYDWFYIRFSGSGIARNVCYWGVKCHKHGPGG